MSLYEDDTFEFEDGEYPSDVQEEGDCLPEYEDEEETGEYAEDPEVDNNWDGHCYNCGSSHKPRRREDRAGIYWQCPDCKSQHDNNDNITGGYGEM